MATPTIKKQYAWIGPNNGYAEIFWDAEDPGDYDWVGLYSDQNQDQDKPDDWQWVSNGSSYVTNSYIYSGFSVRYITWVATAGNTVPDYPKLNLDEVDEKGERKMRPEVVLSALSGSYSELMRSRTLDLEKEVNAAGEFALSPGCWVEPYSSGYARINWSTPKNQEDKDWVALYTDVSKGNGDYISGAWQWAKGKNHYDTSQAYIPGIHVRYIREVDSKYIALRRSKPIAKGYLDLSNIYNDYESVHFDSQIIPDSIRKILEIMVNQVVKAILWQPSVLSPGFGPFPENLLFKNLSFAEAKVMHAELEVSQYYAAILIYYETYRMAIEIADDGERNAKRHAFWQISMVNKFGRDFAKKIGDAHEEGRPGTAEDNRVDDLNNAAALKYAAEHPGVDPRQAADTMWDEGLIVGYKPEVAPQHTKDEL